jgi:glycine cleavage system H protein
MVNLEFPREWKRFSVSFQANLYPSNKTERGKNPMEIPKGFLYTKEHEWVLVEDDLATVGITDYAQSELGDVVFVELPEIGDEVEAAESFGTIEAVKTVSELFSPLTGTVVEVNELLADSPDLVNMDPYGEGWMIKVKYTEIPEEDLLSAAEYREMIS